MVDSASRSGLKWQGVCPAPRGRLKWLESEGLGGVQRAVAREPAGPSPCRMHEIASRLPRRESRGRAGFSAAG